MTDTTTPGPRYLLFLPLDSSTWLEKSNLDTIADKLIEWTMGKKAVLVLPLGSRLVRVLPGGGQEVYA